MNSPLYLLHDQMGVALHKGNNKQQSNSLELEYQTGLLSSYHSVYR